MYQRILVPVDGSDTSNKGLDEAIALARLSGGTLRLIHVVDDLLIATGSEPLAAYSGDIQTLMHTAGEKVLAEGKARALARGATVETVLLEPLVARVAERVLEQARAWQAELIVIGTHGRRGVGRLFMGSDAEQVARLAPVPVLLVRLPQAVQPA